MSKTSQKPFLRKQILYLVCRLKGFNSLFEDCILDDGVNFPLAMDGCIHALDSPGNQIGA